MAIEMHAMDGRVSDEVFPETLENDDDGGCARLNPLGVIAVYGNDRPFEAR